MVASMPTTPVLNPRSTLGGSSAWNVGSFSVASRPEFCFFVSSASKAGVIRRVKSAAAAMQRAESAYIALITRSKSCVANRSEVAESTRMAQCP